ncbi:MAG TPA: hypothetical protein VNI78_02505, partial [Vicinamibacterales bacterium]|nr:hypothetical protein [Vicinamibacterales bacterium]
MRGIRGFGLTGLAAAVLLAAASSASAAVTTAKIRYVAPTGGSEQTLFDHEGLQIIGGCGPGGDTSIALRGTLDNSMLFVNGQGGESIGAVGNPGFNSGSAVFMPAILGLDGTFDAGQILFSRPNGTHITIDWAMHEDALFPSANQCGFWGVATIAKPGGRNRGSRRRIDFRKDASRKGKTVLEAKGLKLKASCKAGNLGVLARTKADHAVLHANSQGLTEHYAGDENLRTKERFRLIKRLGLTAGDALDSGQLIYATPRGAVVSVDWIARTNGAYGTGAKGGRGIPGPPQFDCAFVGTARTLGKRAGDRAWFARRRPEGLPASARRGSAPIPLTPFFERPPFGLSGRCIRAEGTDRILRVSGGSAEAGAFVGAEQASAGDAVSGTSAASGFSAGALTFPDHAAGHMAFVAAGGAVL